jgi:hypothetical protein
MPQATNGSSTPVNSRRKHKTNPLSFSSLRPSSLPAPSVLNAAFKPKQPLPPSNSASASSSSDINSQSQSRLASLPSGIRNHVPRQPLDDNEETQSPTIADGPSSVPSGSKNGRSWAIFTRNKGGKTTYPEDTVIAEEAEDELTSVTSKSVVDPEEDDSTTQFPCVFLAQYFSTFAYILHQQRTRTALMVFHGQCPFPQVYQERGHSRIPITKPRRL